MVDPKRILLVSRDVMALQTRKLMLGAYFDVSAAGRVVEAQILLSAQSFDLIVLCYTLTADDCQKIIEAVRQHSPGAKFLVLTIDGFPANRLGIRAHSLPAEQGPFFLVKKSAELLGFEFRSKGRMVPSSQPSAMVA